MTHDQAAAVNEQHCGFGRGVVDWIHVCVDLTAVDLFEDVRCDARVPFSRWLVDQNGGTERVEITPARPPVRHVLVHQPLETAPVVVVFEMGKLMEDHVVD